MPVIATHSCFRFGKQHYGVTEETLLRIKARKGVVGLIMAQHQLRDGVRDKRAWTFKQSWRVFQAHIDGSTRPEAAGDMKKLTRALQEHYGAEDGERIASGNARRFLGSGWRGVGQSAVRDG